MPAELLARLYDQPQAADANPFTVLDLDYPNDRTAVWDGMTLAKVWAEYEAEVLADWIAENPGTRPSLWWKYSAPRQPLGAYPGRYYDGTLPEPRKRLGGIGTPAHEVLANVPDFPFGISAHWITTQDMSTWPSLAGRAEPADTDSPPIFESQAAYLERHGLLLPGERKLLTAEDFEPDRLWELL
jgi:hypothetical protein